MRCHEGNCILLFYPIVPYVILDIFEASLHIVVAGRRLFHSSRLGGDEYISFAIVSLPSTRDHLDTRHLFTYRKHVQQPFSSISVVLQPLHPSFHSPLLPSLLRSPQVAKHISPPSKLSPQVNPPPFSTTFHQHPSAYCCTLPIPTFPTSERPTSKDTVHAYLIYAPKEKMRRPAGYVHAISLPLLFAEAQARGGRREAES